MIDKILEQWFPTWGPQTHCKGSRVDFWKTVQVLVNFDRTRKNEFTIWLVQLLIIFGDSLHHQTEGDDFMRNRQWFQNFVFQKKGIFTFIRQTKLVITVIQCIDLQKAIISSASKQLGSEGRTIS